MTNFDSAKASVKARPNETHPLLLHKKAVRELRE